MQKVDRLPQRAISDIIPITLTAVLSRPRPRSDSSLHLALTFRAKWTVVCFLSVISLSLCQNTFHDRNVSRNILQVKMYAGQTILIISCNALKKLY